MSTAQPSFDNRVVKSRAEIKAEKDRLYKSSFGDLPDETIYRDPLGMKAGEPVTLQADRYEQLAKQPVADLDGRSIFDEWDRLQRNGFSVRSTMDQIRKNLDTGDWSLPIDIIPEVFVVDVERTPLADMLPRVTTQDDTVEPTPLTETPSIFWGLENTSDTDSSYQYSDPSYADVSFDVQGYGAATRIEDKLILASSNVRSAESSQEQAFVRGMRQETERQIVNGTNNNSNGFDGLADQATEEVDLGTYSGVSNWDEQFRQLIDEAEFQGASRENMAVVTDFDTHRNLRNSQLTEVQYLDPESELVAGFTELTLDQVPIFKTHALTKGGSLSGSGNDIAYTVNMDAHYLSVLQETQVKPLAKDGPQEEMAIDAYATMVFEDNGTHVRSITADS